jgi:anti-anti-sigma factor
MNDRLVVLRLAGDWDVYRVDELESLVLPVRDRSRLILDLSECRYLDCAFLGRLATLRRYRNARGLQAGRIVIRSDFLRRIFDLVGFTGMWPVYATISAARSSFRVPAA